MSKPMSHTQTSSIAAFRTDLSAMKSQIDRDITLFLDGYLSAVTQEYGEASAEAMTGYADFMKRGGKRIRGALALQAYHLFGGTNDVVATGAARIIEMIHAYVLIVDDICDHSDVRRGGPTAHRQLEAWHRRDHLSGDPEHFGSSMATLAALAGAHEAMLQITALPVSHERRVAALENLNRFLVITCHGQFNDLVNEAMSTSDQHRVEDVLLWKTAYYTFANPLQFGALLAGAEPPALQQLFDYSLAAGRAFQISDDIIGIYGDEATSGKSPMDDIKEGKRTLLTVKALELAAPTDAAFLERMLGNGRLTMTELERCRDIITNSGARAYAQTELEHSAAAARAALRGGVLPEASPAVQFLDGLAGYLMQREA